MENKNIDKIIDSFYKFNELRPERYVDNSKSAFYDGKICDEKICIDNLKQKLLDWSNTFDENDKQYFYELFSHFRYIPEDLYKCKLSNLVDCINEKLKEKGISKEDILYVTVSSKSGVSSGCDIMRAELRRLGYNSINKNQVIANVERIDQDVIINAKAIVFIDDVILSGLTIINTMNDFIARFPDVDFNNKEIICTALQIKISTTKYIKKRTRESGIDFHILCNEEQEIKSAFKKGYVFPKEQQKEIEKIVKRYEDLIDDRQNNDDGKTYSMGFKESKVLLAFTYDTPNNTLCNFWKKTEFHKPIFKSDRIVNSNKSRITVNDLKKKKKESKNKAYKYGCKENQFENK